MEKGILSHGSSFRVCGEYAVEGSFLLDGHERYVCSGPGLHRSVFFVNQNQEDMGVFKPRAKLPE